MIGARIYASSACRWTVLNTGRRIEARGCGLAGEMPSEEAASGANTVVLARRAGARFDSGAGISPAHPRIGAELRCVVEFLVPDMGRGMTIQKYGSERVVRLGVGRAKLWALSPLSYLTFPPAHPVELRARIGRCRTTPCSSAWSRLGLDGHRPRRVPREGLARLGTQVARPDSRPMGERYALCRSGCPQARR
jgi:hypothetical protein